MKNSKCKILAGAVLVVACITLGVNQDTSNAFAKAKTTKVSSGKISTSDGKVSVNKKTKLVTLTKSGTYTVSGSISGYTLKVSADKLKISLILKSATIKNSKTACIMNGSATSQLSVKSYKNTASRIEGPASFPVATKAVPTQPDAVIYSKGALTLTGSGSIQIVDISKNGEGIHSKAGLAVSSGKLTVQTKHIGIHGENVAVKSGTTVVNATDTSIQGSKSVVISGGTLSLSSGDKGIFSKSKVAISGGNITVKVSKISGTTFNDIRGIVAGKKDESVGSIDITGGTIHANTYGDCLFATGNITIKAGTATLVSSGDDGIQAKSILTISSGVKLSITAKGKKTKAAVKRIASDVKY